MWGIRRSTGIYGDPRESWSSTPAATFIPSGSKMLDIFRGLKSLIKISHVHIDTAVFRLHYSLTVILLIAFSLIVTTRQYVGNPIDCIHSKDLPEDVLNTYCWIHSTYTITAAYRKREGFEVPFPGVDNSKSHPESERKEYRYYQWVCFMLFLQVINCWVVLIKEMIGRINWVSYC